MNAIPEPKLDDSLTERDLLFRIAREMTQMRQLLTTVVVAIREAESEVPESMRRFMQYFHDLHDIQFVYEEKGHPLPAYLLRELERCDDRYRQLLEKHHTDGGVFEKVRREMAKDSANRWDHTRQLSPPKEKT